MKAKYIGKTFQHFIEGKEYEVEEVSISCYGNNNGYIRNGLKALGEIGTWVICIGDWNCSQWIGKFSKKYGTEKRL